MKKEKSLSNIIKEKLDFLNKKNEQELFECSRKLHQTLCTLWLNEKLCDVCLVVENQQYYTHKLAVLTHCKLLQCYLINTQPKHLVKIELCKSTKLGVENILSYIYSGKIKINELNFAHVYVTAHELGVDALIESCEGYIGKCIDNKQWQDVSDSGSPKNSNFNNCNLEIFANNLQLLSNVKETECCKSLIEYLAVNFNDLIKTNAFLKLDLKNLLNLLENKALKIDKQISLFNAIIKWIDYDRKFRAKYSRKLISYIQFKLISPKDIEKYIEPIEYVINDRKIKEKVKNVLKLHALKNGDYERIESFNIEKEKEKPRMYMHANTPFKHLHDLHKSLHDDDESLDLVEYLMNSKDKNGGKFKYSNETNDDRKSKNRGDMSENESERDSDDDLSNTLIDITPKESLKSTRSSYETDELDSSSLYISDIVTEPFEIYKDKNLRIHKGLSKHNTERKNDKKSEDDTPVIGTNKNESRDIENESTITNNDEEGNLGNKKSSKVPEISIESPSNTNLKIDGLKEATKKSSLDSTETEHSEDNIESESKSQKLSISKNSSNNEVNNSQIKIFQESNKKKEETLSQESEKSDIIYNKNEMSNSSRSARSKDSEYKNKSDIVSRNGSKKHKNLSIDDKAINDRQHISSTRNSTVSSCKKTEDSKESYDSNQNSKSLKDHTTTISQENSKASQRLSQSEKNLKKSASSKEESVREYLKKPIQQKNLSNDSLAHKTTNLKTASSKKQHRISNHSKKVSKETKSKNSKRAHDLTIAKSLKDDNKSVISTETNHSLHKSNHTDKSSVSSKNSILSQRNVSKPESSRDSIHHKGKDSTEPHESTKSKSLENDKKSIISTETSKSSHQSIHSNKSSASNKKTTLTKSKSVKEQDKTATSKQNNRSINSLNPKSIDIKTQKKEIKHESSNHPSPKSSRNSTRDKSKDSKESHDSTRTSRSMKKSKKSIVSIETRQSSHESNHSNKSLVSRKNTALSKNKSEVKSNRKNSRELTRNKSKDTKGPHNSTKSKSLKNDKESSKLAETSQTSHKSRLSNKRSVSSKNSALSKSKIAKEINRKSSKDSTQNKSKNSKESHNSKSMNNRKSKSLKDKHKISQTSLNSKKSSVKSERRLPSKSNSSIAKQNSISADKPNNSSTQTVKESHAFLSQSKVKEPNKTFVGNKSGKHLHYRHKNRVDSKKQSTSTKIIDEPNKTNSQKSKSNLEKPSVNDKQTEIPNETKTKTSEMPIPGKVINTNEIKNDKNETKTDTNPNDALKESSRQQSQKKSSLKILDDDAPIDWITNAESTMRLDTGLIPNKDWDLSVIEYVPPVKNFTVKRNTNVNKRQGQNSNSNQSLRQNQIGKNKRKNENKSFKLPQSSNKSRKKSGFKLFKIFSLKKLFSRTKASKKDIKADTNAKNKNLSASNLSPVKRDSSMSNKSKVAKKSHSYLDRLIEKPRKFFKSLSSTSLNKKSRSSSHTKPHHRKRNSKESRKDNHNKSIPSIVIESLGNNKVKVSTSVSQLQKPNSINFLTVPDPYANKVRKNRAKKQPLNKNANNIESSSVKLENYLSITKELQYETVQNKKIKYDNELRIEKASKFILGNF